MIGDPYEGVRLGTWKVLISPPVIGALEPFRQRTRGDLESGGVLLGEVAGGTLLVTDISLPTDRDRRSRHGFVRHRTSAQASVDRAHIESGGRWTYLGEWHTHPASVAAPSCQDRRMIRRQHRLNDAPTGVLLLLILGTDKDFIGLWDGHRLLESTIPIRTE